MYYSHLQKKKQKLRELKASSGTHTVFEPGFRPRELDFSVRDRTQGISQKNNYGGYALILQSKYRDGNELNVLTSVTPHPIYIHQIMAFLPFHCMLCWLSGI